MLVGGLVLGMACEADPPPDASGPDAAATDPTTSAATASAPDGVEEPATDPGGRGASDPGDPSAPSTNGEAPGATTVVPGGTTVSLPGRPGRGGSIRSIDLAHLTYPTSTCADVIDDPPSSGFALVDGEARATADDPSGPYTVTLTPDRSYGDINADGHDDAAVIIACSRGGQPVPVGWIYTVDEAGPRPLAGVALGRDALPITGVLDTSLTDLRITGSRVTSGWDVYLDGDALCCASKHASVTWTWIDGRLTPGPPTITSTAAG